MNKIDNVQYFCCRCDHRHASNCCDCEQTGAWRRVRRAVAHLQDTVFDRFFMECGTRHGTPRMFARLSLSAELPAGRVSRIPRPRAGLSTTSPWKTYRRFERLFTLARIHPAPLNGGMSGLDPGWMRAVSQRSGGGPARRCQRLAEMPVSMRRRRPSISGIRASSCSVVQS